MKKTNEELKENELEKIAGGYPCVMLHVTCPCGCKTYYQSCFAPSPVGTVKGPCSNGWKCTITGDTSVVFYNEVTKESIEASLKSTY